MALLWPTAVTAQDTTALPPTLVTTATLKARSADAEAQTNLSEEQKKKLLDLYQEALRNREEARANIERAAEFEKIARTAPEQTELIGKQLELAKSTDPITTISVTLQDSLEQVEQQLHKEQADLAAVDARRADFGTRLSDEVSRPVLVRKRLAAGQQKIEEIAVALQAQPAVEQNAALAEAQRWALETRKAALSSEIHMLNQELISQSVRVKLLKARQEQAALKVDRIGARVKRLNELVNEKRKLEAEQAKQQAEDARRELASLDPLLISLADKNAELTDNLNVIASRMNSLDLNREQVKKLMARIEADYKDIEETLKTSGLAEGLGQLLVAQREALPDIREYRRNIQVRRDEIARMVVGRLYRREEARRISNLDEAVAGFEAQLTAAASERLSDALRTLVRDRQELLKKSLEADEYFLAKLHELNETDQKLIDLVRAYEDFLSEHMLWLGSADSFRLTDLYKLPEEVRRLLSPSVWFDLMQTFLEQVSQSIVFWMGLLLAAVLLWKRRALLAGIQASGTRLGKPTKDKFSYSLRALLLSLLVVLPLSLVLAVSGWQLQVAQGSYLAEAIGQTLIRVAMLVYVLRVLHMICAPGGLAQRHFRWPEASVGLLRVELRRLLWIFVPVVLATRLAIDLNPVESGGNVAEVGAIIAYGLLSLFFYRVFHPARGVLSHLQVRNQSTLLLRSYRLWYSLLVIFPLGLMILVLIGYVYTATSLTAMFLGSLWMILGLVLVHALAQRWLLVVRRRLAYEATIERRRAALAAREAEKSEGGDEESGLLEVEEPVVDLETLDEESRSLLKIAVFFTGLVGLYLVWSPILPAMRMFGNVTLWYHTVMLEGVETLSPITLASLGLALIYAIGTVVLVRQLPSVLEIILLQRFDMSAANRYTVKTLTTYAIVTIGIVAVLNTIGAPWSKLQWLVAALGVGIGFGLQEIVANFISGLIILFERPIRVGDIVTVGDTDGLVTRIRIRATTIRNWDRKELLVPNKEFITSRLLNWSLSDATTRIVITVGVAYGSDVDKALALMREAAEEHENVLDDPAPSLVFDGFGDNALTLHLRVFVCELEQRVPTITDLHRAINRKFNQAGIVIAFPQRDIHLDTSEPLRISMERSPKI
jgi:potassium efflux system protein